MTKLVEELRMYASMSNHPDLLVDAADEITALRDKNARLRAALKQIAKYSADEDEMDWADTVLEMNAIARAAMEET